MVNIFYSSLGREANITYSVCFICFWQNLISIRCKMIYYIGMDFHMNSIHMQNYVKEDLSHKEYIYIYNYNWKIEEGVRTIG